jgi:hypothetical protein
MMRPADRGSTMTTRKAVMRRQGGQYIVLRWDDSVQCYRESAPLSYWVARAAVGQANCPGARGGKCRCASHRHDAM